MGRLARNAGPIQKKLDQDKLTSRFFRKFDHAIKTEATRKRYTISLDQFMRFAKIPQYGILKDLKTDDLQDTLEDFVMSLSDHTGNSVACLFAPIKLFLGMNRIAYFPIPLVKLFPANNHIPSGKVPYTTQDVQWLLDASTSIRTNAIVLFFASTGCRPGGAKDEDGFLQKKHATELPDGNFNIKVYADTKFEYDAFLTPEASDALRAYFDLRRNKGHDLHDDAPLFATLNGTKPLSATGIENMIANLIEKTPIKRKIVRAGRHDKAVIYGFRKRFNTILKIDNEVNSNIAEKLMAHSKGLDGTYLAPSMEECYIEFKKAIPQLTISKLEQTKIKLSVAELKLGGSITKEQVEMIFDLMQKTGVIANGRKEQAFIDNVDELFSKAKKSP